MNNNNNNTLASKKAVHSILASRLTHLHIPFPSSSAADDPSQDFNFSDLFGPAATSSSPSSSSALFLGDPQVIHHRSHSFVGPPPRFTLCKSLPPFEREELYYSSSDDIGGSDVKDGVLERESGGVCGGGGGGGGDGVVGNVEVKKVVPGDFEIMRVIGKGAFGKVFQVRMKGKSGGGDGDGDGIFAMKVMRKDTIIKNNHVDYMRAERDILTKVVHPFIVQLRYSFQTKSKLYLILDFINGGHLFYHLYRQGRQGIFSEDQARVYTAEIAEIVSAVSHLHKSGIVHRDLKPENILMGVDGHVMLTDFGLAKEIDESNRSNSVCGTTEYMAPEILQSKGHNKNADWWSVGILLYEMINGQARK